MRVGGDAVPTVRDAFFQRIYEMIQSGEDIYIISADLAAPSLDDLRAHCPERFISVGIAEQSLVSISAGLAETGKKVIAYGLNPFPVTRAYDQVRCLMGELAVPMTLCGLNAGLASAAAGYTHMAVDVFGMMRMLPNVRIYNPSDTSLAELLADRTLEMVEPRYIMFDKDCREKIYSVEELAEGKGYVLYQPLPGAKVAILSYGAYTQSLRRIVDDFVARGISVAGIDMYAVPCNEEAFLSDINLFRAVMSVEENVLSGGLGSYLLELLSDHGRDDVFVKRLGVDWNKGMPDVFTNREHFRKVHGIGERDIVAAVSECLERVGVQE